MVSDSNEVTTLSSSASNLFSILADFLSRMWCGIGEWGLVGPAHTPGSRP